MANISEKTANWRLFGGGAFILGGLLLLVGAILPLVGVTGSWLAYLFLAGIVIFGIGFAFVAFGETGSNGAVGNLLWGKIALVVAGLAWAVYGLGLVFFTENAIISTVALYVAIAAGLVSGVAILQKDVAKGLARFILFITSLGGLLLVFALELAPWGTLVFAVLVLLNGAIYLFNGKAKV